MLHKAGAPHPCMESMTFDDINIGGRQSVSKKQKLTSQSSREMISIKTPPWKSSTQYTGGAQRGRWARMGGDRQVLKDSLLQFNALVPVPRLLLTLVWS